MRVWVRAGEDEGMVWVRAGVDAGLGGGLTHAGVDAGMGCRGWRAQVRGCGCEATRAGVDAGTGARRSRRRCGMRVWVWARRCRCGY